MLTRLRLCAVLCFIGLGLLASMAHAAEKPNVVLIIGDDQAWGDFGFMGHPTIQTPRIDRLASESLVFTRGYVPSSLCRPSLATLATGLYPHQHKITSNDPPRQIPRADFLRQRQEQIAYIDKVPTLPRMLAGSGYKSLQTGKWWEGNPRRGGFTHGMTHGDPARGGRHGDVGLKIGREGLDPIFRFIDECESKPFFLWYAPFLPHSPHNPPERLLAKYRDKTDSIHIARYWAMCEWFDETCGQLLDHLDEKGLAKNTIVLFVVDNGWIQRRDSGRYAPRSKRSPNEGGIRTPMMVRWPGRIEPKRNETNLAISTDLVPTILTACGLVPTDAMQGVNLLDAQAVTMRQSVQGEIFTHNAVDIHEPATSLEYRWMIDGRWKLIVPDTTNVPNARPELYDILADPHEKADLSASQPQRITTMEQKLDTWWPGPFSARRESE